MKSYKIKLIDGYYFEIELSKGDTRIVVSLMKKSGIKDLWHPSEVFYSNYEIRDLTDEFGNIDLEKMRKIAQENCHRVGAVIRASELSDRALYRMKRAFINELD